LEIPVAQSVNHLLPLGQNSPPVSIFLLRQQSQSPAKKLRSFPIGEGCLGLIAGYGQVPNGPLLVTALLKMVSQQGDDIISTTRFRLVAGGSQDRKPGFQDFPNLLVKLAAVGMK
jgi:hypothetical protein